MPVQTEEYDYAALAPKVKAALRRAFPTNFVIEIEEGYQGRIRAKVISGQLNGMREQEKQNYLWDILRQELGAASDSISYVLAYGTDRL